MPYRFYKRGKNYDINDPSNEQNVESRVAILLNNLPSICAQHILTYYATFNSDVNFNDVCISNNGIYEYGNTVTIHIYEWCDGNLMTYIMENYQTMTLEQWTIIFFQLLFTLATIQSIYPTFRSTKIYANACIFREPT